MAALSHGPPVSFAAFQGPAAAGHWSLPPSWNTLTAAVKLPACPCILWRAADACATRCAFSCVTASISTSTRVMRWISSVCASLAIGLEGNAVDNTDDVGDLLCRIANRRHGCHHPADNGAAFDRDGVPRWPGHSPRARWCRYRASCRPAHPPQRSNRSMPAPVAATAPPSPACQPQRRPMCR